MNPEPDQPSHGREYPSLENSPSVDPNAPVNYPPDAGLPPMYATPFDGQQPPPPGFGQPNYPPPGYPPPPPAAPGYPQYPGGAYPYAYDPYGSTRPPGTNGKAIASLITSLVGLLFCGVPSIVGLVLGVLAMRETKQTGQEGHGLALAGVIVGALAVAGWLLYVLFFVILIAAAPNYY